MWKLYIANIHVRNAFSRLFSTKLPYVWFMVFFRYFVIRFLIVNVVDWKWKKFWWKCPESLTFLKYSLFPSQANIKITKINSNFQKKTIIFKRTHFISTTSKFDPIPNRQITKRNRNDQQVNGHRIATFRRKSDKKPI